MDSKDDCKCKCVHIGGHLEAVNWILWPRKYKPSAGCLSVGDWVDDPHIWLDCVESCDGSLPVDDVLKSLDTRYWSIHDVQRYFVSEEHCEKILFTYQYPNLRMPTRLGSYFWRANTALKQPSTVYRKELCYSMEITLKNIESKQIQMDRLIISDQLIKLELLDYFKRKTFFRILRNILCLQDELQLVSFENMCCRRLEGVRLLQHLACFNAESLKYLFLWRFFLPNENPLLINYSYITVCLGNQHMTLPRQLLNILKMTTDEEKSRIAKLLQGVDVPEMKLTERCSDLLKDFHQKFDKEVEEEEQDDVTTVYENPYRVDRKLMEENDRKLRELLSESKRAEKKENTDTVECVLDPKRPWRTHSNKEKLLRIDNELKQHIEKASQLIPPLADDNMKELVKECQQETLEAPPVSSDRLRLTVDAARKNLTNFQYRKIENSTATSILPDAHKPENSADPQTPSDD